MAVKVCYCNWNKKRCFSYVARRISLFPGMIAACEKEWRAAEARSEESANLLGTQQSRSPGYLTGEKEGWAGTENGMNFETDDYSQVGPEALGSSRDH